MALSTKFASGILLAVISLIIVYTILAETAADIGTAADGVATYNVSGTMVDGDNDAYTALPLTSFFKKKGVILLALMAGIVIIVITAVMNPKR